MIIYDSNGFEKVDLGIDANDKGILDTDLAQLEKNHCAI